MDAPKHLAPSEPFAGLLGYHLRRASVHVMADLAQALAPLGLKPAEASVLFLIAARDGATQAEIGRVLGIQRANMAPLLANLMKNGLVEREAVDGRSQALRLSKPGEAAHQAAMAATHAHETRLFGTLSAADRATMIAHLRGFWQDAET